MLLLVGVFRKLFYFNKSNKRKKIVILYAPFLDNNRNLCFFFFERKEFMLLVGVICWAGLGLARCAAHVYNDPVERSRRESLAPTSQKTEPPRVGGATDSPFHRRRAPPRPARPYMSPACSLLSPHAPRRILPLLLPLRLSSSAISAPPLAMPRRDGVRLLLLPSIR